MVNILMCFIVFNMGVPGENSKQILNRVDQVIYENPDIVILMCGTNDFLNEKKLLSEDEYIKNIKEMIKKIGNNRIILLTIPPVDKKLYYQRHDSLKIKSNVDTLILKCNNIIKSFKDEVEIIDIAKYFTVLGNYNLLFDGVHPNENGVKIIALAIAERIICKQMKRKKIICFGDSITKGLELEKTYPQYLEGLIK